VMGRCGRDVSRYTDSPSQSRGKRKVGVAGTNGKGSDVNDALGEPRGREHNGTKPAGKKRVWDYIFTDRKKHLY